MLSGPIEMWHHLVEKRDTRGLDALLADEAVFYSPVVHTHKEISRGGLSRLFQ